MIRVLPFGGWRNRQPLAYAPIRAAAGDAIGLAAGPEEADILLVSHHWDFTLFGPEIRGLLARAPQSRLVLLSEEPLWDISALPDPLSLRQRVAVSGAEFDLTVLNHHSSTIFRSLAIPYFLLTDRRYIAHYRPLFDRNAGWSAADWRRHFAEARHEAVFLAERRLDPALERDFPEVDFHGLSVRRSRLAETCLGTRVIREGRGWTTAPLRQALPDWHLDKLERFDLSCRIMSAVENTHQPDYVSEKIWDAFAVGAIPLYAASAGHAVHRLVGSRGWINLQDRLDRPFDPSARDLWPDPADYARVQARLAALFADESLIMREYERLGAALRHDLQRALG
ncbi:glycosyltransferase family 10 domain-containing protein [Pseudogemmobacter sonorensis]|uniref:glycosyltransferase family 10 domain-containing protein n=1 Tax=Pseudogemmobacter sonorensis TaxID=2989681 RepID=UPI0036D054C0